MDEPSPESATKNSPNPKNSELMEDNMQNRPASEDLVRKTPSFGTRFPAEGGPKVRYFKGIGRLNFVEINQAPPNFEDIPIKELSVYFPQYSPIFAYLNFLVQPPEAKEAETHPSKQPEESEAPPMVQFARNLLITAHPGHDLRVFLSLYCMQYHIPIQFHSFFPISDRDARDITNSVADQMMYYSSQTPDKPEIIVFYFGSPPAGDRQIAGQFISKVLSQCLKRASRKIFFTLTNTGENIMEIKPVPCDFHFSMALPGFESRSRFLEGLGSFFQHDHVNYEHLSRQLQNWNYQEIREFYQACHRYHALEMLQTNGKSKKVPITTEYFVNQLVQGMLKPRDAEPSQGSLETSHNPPSPSEIRQIIVTEQSKTPILGNSSKEFRVQLYQEAASLHYEDLILILDKLQKGIVLHDNERSLLGDYPFLLKDRIETAIKTLEKAHARVEQLKHTVQ